MWTSDRVEALKAKWADGLSASQIASELGEVTRNAVIGKVHRLGLAGRGSGAKPGQRRAPRAPRDTIFSRPKPRKFPHVMVAHVSDAEPTSLKLGIQELTNKTCCWPLGDPMEKGFHFCGRRKSSGIPYCEHHAAIAYNPAASLRTGRS